MTRKSSQNFDFSINSIKADQYPSLMLPGFSTLLKLLINGVSVTPIVDF